MQYSGASGKSFLTYEDAEKWLSERNQRKYRCSLSVSGGKFILSGYAKSPKEVLANMSMDVDMSPRSTSYWSDHEPLRVDVGIQCPEITSHLPAKVNPESAVATENSLSEIPPVNPAPGPPVQLSPEQQKVLSVVKSGKNVFFTGPAGKLPSRVGTF